jgi:N-acetylglucosamine-6-sulfatase
MRLSRYPAHVVRPPETQPLTSAAAARLRRRLRTPAYALLALFALLSSSLGAITVQAPAASGAVKPSVLIILTDDQRFNQTWPMNTVQHQLMKPGIEFRRGYVTNPLCCPSRASILTGNYSHTTHVWRDTSPDGGYQTFTDEDQNNTIATRLQAAGYTTGLFGKYLNGYWGPAMDTGVVPPGWDQWMAFPHAGYYGFDLNVNGTITHYGNDQYSTTVLGNAAANFIRTTSGPTFTYFAPYGPHNPATPEVKYQDAFDGQLPQNRSPAYNEKDVSDKPGYIQQRPRLSGEDKAKIDRFRVNQLRTLKSVDDSVATILKALQDTGRLNNTLIFFLSDNGLQEGEHRWKSKRVPYEESIHVPFVVRYDPLITTPRADTQHLVLNIDIAPTIEQVAGIGPTPMDGTSLIPLLSNHPPPGRQKFLIEHLPRKETQPPPAYCAVHTLNYVYVYYGTGEQELYDLKKDRAEENNVVHDKAYRNLRDRLRGALKHMCDPPPPGMQLPGS